MTDRKSELETLKADLTARLSRYEAHQHREAGALDKDFEEQATQTQNDEVVDSLETETRAELVQIEHALARIESGVGDECESCGEASTRAVCRCCPIPRSVSTVPKTD